MKERIIYVILWRYPDGSGAGAQMAYETRQAAEIHREGFERVSPDRYWSVEAVSLWESR
jgi:hypothetical protein